MSSFAWRTKRTKVILSPAARRQLDELKEGGWVEAHRTFREAVQKFKAADTGRFQWLPADMLDSKTDSVSVASWMEAVAQFIDKKPRPTSEPPSITPLSTLVISKLIIPEKKLEDGLVVLSTGIEWDEILKHLDRDWENAFKIPPEKWEELIAGAYKRAGFDEVILTPRSNDKGRDLIAYRHGVGTVKVLGSVKAYGPGKLVRHDDVRALVGVLGMEPNASKGVLTTTSDFAPMVMKDPRYTNLMPTRLELMNGKKLQEWLRALSKK
jgi:restriction system protein